MNKINKLVISVIVLILIIGVTYLLIKDRKATEDETVRIGAILILSGVGANWGENSQRGAELAVEEINQRGGINGRPLEIIYQDNPGDSPKDAVNALHNLISRDIGVVLGTNWTPSGLATAPIACEKEVVMISPSLGVGEFNETCDYLFNVWPHDDVLSRYLGGWLYEEGYRNIAVLGSIQEWENAQANAVKEGFENAGGQLAIFEITQKDEKDFKTAAAKIKAANPDAIVFTNFSYEHLAAKRLRELQIETPFFSILIDNERIQGASGALEGAIAITSFAPSKKFIDKFIKKYEMSPDIGTDTSYDAINLIAEAMNKTNSTDPGLIKDYINSLDSYLGASGQLKFDGKGGVTKDPKFIIVQGGAIVPYK